MEGEVVAPKVQPRIRAIECIYELSERKNEKRGNKMCCLYKVVLGNSMEVLFLATTQATGQHKYHIKFTTDTLKSNGTNIYICLHTTIYQELLN